jgi:LAO/AO transport system kinase
VLAVDPSSSLSGGSILGDKTRMPTLAADPGTFIRPSPSGGALGGVARHTREAMLLCEAAGYDAVIVETVGVGQSEYTVASMVDFFLVLLLAGAGDEIQGLKKGILELADALAINKADGDNRGPAQTAAKVYELALHLLQPSSPRWHPPVLTCSALEMTGIERIWETVIEHHESVAQSGELEQSAAGCCLDVGPCRRGLRRVSPAILRLWQLPHPAEVERGSLHQPPPPTGCFFLDNEIAP